MEYVTQSCYRCITAEEQSFRKHTYMAKTFRVSLQYPGVNSNTALFVQHRVLTCLSGIHHSSLPAGKGIHFQKKDFRANSLHTDSLPSCVVAWMPHMPRTSAATRRSQGYSIASRRAVRDSASPFKLHYNGTAPQHSTTAQHRASSHSYRTNSTHITALTLKTSPQHSSKQEQ
ncbi:hypothetical protein E2C01_043037 [Portunus trituberculatus]|uniref:Uncharacterized protein n=1 Tax=Portunus trituberculatus TaxID=210409 RepID=A0A5B7FNE5_PORTR|nr:hypothetical protein [Portunus trituberculatus]